MSRADKNIPFRAYLARDGFFSGKILAPIGRTHGGTLLFRTRTGEVCALPPGLVVAAIVAEPEPPPISLRELWDTYPELRKMFLRTGILRLPRS